MSWKIRKLSVRDLAWAAVAIASVAVLTSLIGDRIERSRADDTADINAVIDAFQTAYSAKMVDDIRPLFYGESVIAYDFGEGRIQAIFGLEEWLDGTQEDVFETNDRISDTLSDREIQVYRNIAYVVCNYTYIDDEQRDQGVDIFTMMKMQNHWRILSLQWTGDEVE